MNVNLVRELLARAAVADAARNAAEARREGKLRENITWRTRLQKIDRRIARYGSERSRARCGKRSQPVFGVFWFERSSLHCGGLLLFRIQRLYSFAWFFVSHVTPLENRSTKRCVRQPRSFEDWAEFA